MWSLLAATLPIRLDLASGLPLAVPEDKIDGNLAATAILVAGRPVRVRTYQPDMYAPAAYTDRL